MLMGENFSRRHNGRLRPRLDRRCHRQQGDHSLAATDIALQQSEHAMSARHIGLNL